MGRPNPDVEELLARNRETCPHPEDRLYAAATAVGSGLPGVVGCRMGPPRTYCGACGAAVDVLPREVRELVEEIAAEVRRGGGLGLR